MRSSDTEGWNVPFHAAKYPRTNRIDRDCVRPGEVTPLLLPEIRSTGRTGIEDASTPSNADLEVEFARRLEAETKAAFQKGYAQAKAESEAGLESLRQQTKGAFEAFRKALERSETENTRDAVDLAVLLAEHVIRPKLTMDVDAMIDALEPLVAELDGAEPLTIMCDPATGELLRSNLGILQERLEIAGVQVEVDESFEPGDAVLQRGASTLDARIRGRLDRMRQVLAQQLGLESGGTP